MPDAFKGGQDLTSLSITSKSVLWFRKKMLRGNPQECEDLKNIRLGFSVGTPR